ncbi:MAG: hypothetical protein KA054_03925 [Candidatus Moranbacteria bacterium]|nr:hypothetical protein [Candidatus Moranbacteria bacterium]
MEDALLWTIALCGFLAGSSAKINKNSVIQREPNLFWLLPAITMGGAALAWLDIVNVTAFLVIATARFSAGIVLGFIVALVFRAETAAIND